MTVLMLAAAAAQYPTADTTLPDVSARPKQIDGM